MLDLLYVVYWGALEPLGQSLVLPPVLRFADLGLRVSLVTFEKPADLADRDRVRETAGRLSGAGVRWTPRRYHRRPTVPATAWDLATGIASGVARSLPRRPHLVHARTYVGGMMGMALGRLLGRPVVFHNEGFWPDEQVDAGVWAPGSRPYRLTKGIEERLYRNADAVITLSEVARQAVLAFRPHRPPETTVVVPSCVDLEHFRPPAPGQKEPLNDGCRLVYVGSLGGRYRLDRMARFLRLMREEVPGTRLSIFSQSDADMIRREIRRGGVEQDWWALDRVPHAEVPAALGRAHAGVQFLRVGPNSRYGSPTKVGEYWACGLPVVTTPETGDVDRIVREERVGVLLESDTEAGDRAAARRLWDLLQDPELPARCRAAAERHYSLERGVATQVALYERLAEKG